MENNIVNSWKNPEYRGQTSNGGTSHPSGIGFQELSVETIEFIAGGNGHPQPQPQITPTVTPVVTGGASGAASAVVSFVASAATNCDD